MSNVMSKLKTERRGKDDVTTSPYTKNKKPVPKHIEFDLAEINVDEESLTKPQDFLTQSESIDTKLNEIFKVRDVNKKLKFKQYQDTLTTIIKHIDPELLVMELEKTLKLESEFKQEKILITPKLDIDKPYIREQIRIKCEATNSINLNSLHQQINPKANLFLPIKGSVLVFRRTKQNNTTRIELKFLFPLETTYNGDDNVESKISYEYIPDEKLLSLLLPIFSCHGEYKRKNVVYTASKTNDYIWTYARYNRVLNSRTGKVNQVLEVEYDPEIIFDSLDLFMFASHFKLFIKPDEELTNKN